MANDFTTDPLTQIHNKLWETLEDNADFTTTVKDKNRIKYSGTDENPSKTERMIADTPQVTIVPQGGPINFHMSSSSMMFTRIFTIVIQSGSLRVNLQVYPLEWLIFKICFAASDTLNLSFVKKFRLVDSTLSRDEIETLGARREWSSTLTIQVDVVIPKTDLAIP